MKVVQKIEGLPGGYLAEYFGKVDSETYFIICRPENSPHIWEYLVFMGPADGLKYVEVKRRMRLSDKGGTIVMETEQGTFRCARRAPCTFNSQPIKVF